MIFEKEPSLIDQEIDRLTEQLRSQIVGSGEYITILDMMSKLNDLKKQEQSSKIGKDKWLMAGTNILGILLVINYERVHVITSEAMKMVQRTKD